VLRERLAALHDSIGAEHAPIIYCIDSGDLNTLDLAAWLARFGAVYEHSPWIAEAAWHKRPFATLDELPRAMAAAVGSASRERQLALVRAHPELAGREAGAGGLTADSSSEQGRLGFTRLTKTELQRMSRLNRSYRERFGFPCIVALRLHADRASVMAEMERRLSNDGETELKNALEQIHHIARGRLEKLLHG
jgi:2-oxo-4-hydroxy-4-carboxy-5-ureidoimidazoline decarboxylase